MHTTNINKVILSGKLGQDPTVRYTPDGTATAYISIATSRQWKNKTTHEWHHEAQLTRVTLFGKLAEIAAEHLYKGTPIYIEARLQTHPCQDLGGQHYTTTEVIATTLQLPGHQGEKDNPNHPCTCSHPYPHNHSCTCNHSCTSNSTQPAPDATNHFDDLPF